MGEPALAQALFKGHDPFVVDDIVIMSPKEHNERLIVHLV